MSHLYGAMEERVSVISSSKYAGNVCVELCPGRVPARLAVGTRAPRGPVAVSWTPAGGRGGGLDVMGRMPPPTAQVSAPGRWRGRVRHGRGDGAAGAACGGAGLRHTAAGRRRTDAYIVGERERFAYSGACPRMAPMGIRWAQPAR
jgi:hypothetical protein